MKKLPERNWIVPQISKTEWVLRKQKSSSETRHSKDRMTARPTNTVDARNAGDKMDAKLSNRPTQRTDSASDAATDSVRLPDPALLSARMVQNLQSPK